MIAFERLKKLCDEQKISLNNLEHKLELSRNTLYSWKNHMPKGNSLTKVADYFDVSVDYLLGRTDKKRYYDLTNKDERDIQTKLQEMIGDISNDTAYSPFDGATLDELEEDDKQAMIASLESALKFAKIVAKRKFTPKKYR